MLLLPTWLMKPIRASLVQKGGTLDPAKRKVTQKDIDQLNINKLNFKDGKAYLGHVSD